MHIINKNADIVDAVKTIARPLGFVPTMGALHKGHLSLVHQARKENATLGVSIFLNPAQFSSDEDLSEYPQNLNRDLELLRKENVDFAFVPPISEIYPRQFDTWVEPGALSKKLEGAHRQEHFRGVATVVTKLFNLVTPDRAYFGQKDGQQSVVIRQLARDLDIGVEVVVLPTVRDPDGLALSSRNVYLSPSEREAAPVIHRSLLRAQELLRDSVRDANQLRGEVEEMLLEEPCISRIDYVSIADAETLEELSEVNTKAMVSVAVYIGNTRLIDNVILE